MYVGPTYIAVWLVRLWRGLTTRVTHTAEPAHQRAALLCKAWWCAARLCAIRLGLCTGSPVLCRFFTQLILIFWCDTRNKAENLWISVIETVATSAPSQYKDHLFKVWGSHFKDGDPYTGKTTSLYWDGPQIVANVYTWHGNEVMRMDTEMGLRYYIKFQSWANWTMSCDHFQTGDRRISKISNSCGDQCVSHDPSVTNMWNQLIVSHFRQPSDSFADRNEFPRAAYTGQFYLYKRWINILVEA